MKKYIKPEVDFFSIQTYDVLTVSLGKSDMEGDSKLQIEDNSEGNFGPWF